MIDSIGSKVSGASELRTDAARGEKVAQVTQAASTKAATASASTVSLGAQAAAKSMAASAPVNEDRVAEIKKAVQEGSFPIYPATIADRLIAFEQGWRGK